MRASQEVFQNLLRVGGLFVLALAVVGLVAVSARTAKHPSAWEFARCGEPPKTLTFNERLICSSGGLRQLDRALGTAYRAKEAVLDAAQTEALRHDHVEWQVQTCRDITGRHPSSAIVRKCLFKALRLRQQFVAALPLDRADVPYRLSHFERVLLQNYVAGPGVLNIMSYTPDDAVRAGLRRVFAAIISREAGQDFPALAPHTVSDFINNAFGDGAQLEASRYFVDFGGKIHDGSQQGMFVVDLETGDMTMASVSANPPARLYIYELACTPQSLKDFARSRFRRQADRSAEDFAFGHQPKEPVQEYISSEPCH